MTPTKKYKICYYKDRRGREPVKEYIDDLSEKEQVKIFARLELLKEREGYLDEPYSKYIKGKVRELIINFSRNRHRIFYFIFTGKRIILLYAFLKKTQKTPRREINKAIINYKDYVTRK